MSIQLMSDDAFVARVSRRSIWPKIVLRTISVVAAIANAIIREIVYIYREETYHGRIERQRQDWER